MGVATTLPELSEWILLTYEANCVKCPNPLMVKEIQMCRVYAVLLKTTSLCKQKS